MTASLMLLQRPLFELIHASGEGFMRQVNRAFTLSQLLANVWTEAAFKPPQAQLARMRAAWTKVSIAAEELSRQLDAPQSELRRELLLHALRSTSDEPLARRFRAPGLCDEPAAEASRALWKVLEDSSIAVLLDVHDGGAWRCDLKTGAMHAASQKELELKSVGRNSVAPDSSSSIAVDDIGSFLRRLSSPWAQSGVDGNHGV
jgi:hypothetical protein